MEKLEMFGIYDRKAKRYDTPFFTLNEIHAKRRFIMMLRNNETVFANFYEDFSLVRLGLMNIVSGRLEARDNDLEIIMTGAEAHHLAEKEA